MTAPVIVPVDQDARDAIRTRLDHNACVEAGAGTGKTAVLVDRIVELLRTQTVTVDQLAVITFTEKAAAELTVRVRQELDAARAKAAPGTPEAAVLHDALSGLHRARIETIHAFAGGLLRERPVEAGLDPQFDIVDALGATLDFDVAYDRWLTAQLAGDDPAIGQALNRTLRVEHLRELAEAINEHRAVLPLAPVVADDPDLEGYLDMVAATVAELDAVEAEFDLPEEDPGVQQLPQVRQYLETVLELQESPSDLERLLAWAKTFKNAGAQRHWDDADGCRRLKKAVKELSEAGSEISEQIRTAALADVMPLVAQFVEEFAAERRRTARLTFDDLLLWARDLVAIPEVREDFRRQFRAILVDEFQDTDPVQAELVLHLTSDGPETDPSKLQPAPGRLVVVGDPKQSIYRFRRADIAIYDQIKRGPLAGDLITIRQSFRSCNDIVNWANRVFDELLEESAGRQPGNVPLGTSGISVSDERASVVVVPAPDADAEPAEGALEARAQEARTLAATLVQAKQEEWLVRDRGTGAERPATWRDMAVLVPARTGLDLYEEAFAAAGIPLRHEGGKTFFRRQEVRELVSYLHAIDDPADRVAIVATLRSPVFGCSDDDLLHWVADGGSWTYLGGWQDTPEGPVRDGLALLRDLHRARAGLSLPELVRRVLDRTHVVEHALTRPGGSETAANLLKLVDQARDFSASGGGGLRAFTRWLARNRDEDSEETDASVSEETDDVVRILTIHGAKGLEFPIVALANLSSRGSGQARPIPDAARHRLHVRVGTQKKSGWFCTPGYDDAKEAEKELIELERIRLLYVAVTRARDHLIIPMANRPVGMLESLGTGLPAPDDPDEAQSLGVRILDRSTLALSDGDEELAEAAEVVPDVEIDAYEAQTTAWAEDRATLLKAASVELPMATATSLEKPWRPVVASAESPDATLILGEGPPIALGDALHRVMELITFPEAADLDPVVAAVCSEGELDDHREEVTRLARRCLESEAVQRAVAADQVVRELPFTVQDPNGAGFVTGRVDLLYREGNAWTVVDYKTDTVESDGLAAAAKHHEAQVSAYIEAVRGVVGVAPRVVLVFARAGGEMVFEGVVG